jgi:uncharacterized cupredoxin-like copper-binding protein
MKTTFKNKKHSRFGPANSVFVVAVLALSIPSYVEPVEASPKIPVPVSVIEGDLFITPLPVEASGDHFVTFNVTNISPIIPHEFIVIRLRKGQTYDKLPISMDPTSEYFGGVDEGALGHQVMGEIGEAALQPGRTAALTLELPKDDYALICNLPGHYVAGMRSPFSTVGHDKDKGKDKD